MTIKSYTYEIESVSDDSRAMMVRYMADGHGDIVVGARVPVNGETLETVIAAFAPWSVWNQATVTFAPPAVGDAGSVVVTRDESDMTLDELKASKREELNRARQTQIETRMDIDGILVSANDHSITMLRSANDALGAGLRATVDWRDDGGSWVTLDRAMADKLLMAVAARVEDCYTLNRQLEATVDAATTTAEVTAIKWETA